MVITLNGVGLGDKVNPNTLLAKVLVDTVIPHIRYSPMKSLIRNYKSCYILVAAYAKAVRKARPKKGFLTRFEKRKGRLFKELKGIKRLSLQRKIMSDVLMGENLGTVHMPRVRMYMPVVEPKNVPIAALTTTSLTSKKVRFTMDDHFFSKKRSRMAF